MQHNRRAQTQTYEMHRHGPQTRKRVICYELVNAQTTESEANRPPMSRERVRMQTNP